MLCNKNIWHAIDKLAKTNGLSVSGLVKLSGLDPTAFNPSKRQTKYGQPRWQSTYSLAKILHATNTSFAEFVKYIEQE